MGKKRPQKTKELSVAIAEASPTGDGTQQAQQPHQTPRKRGRPRKIIEKTESQGKKEEAATREEQPLEEFTIGNQSKKDKINQEEEKQREIEEADKGPSTSSRGKKKEETQSEEREPHPPPRRSRRRKSKPRKSS